MSGLMLSQYMCVVQIHALLDFYIVTSQLRVSRAPPVYFELDPRHWPKKALPAANYCSLHNVEFSVLAIMTRLLEANCAPFASCVTFLKNDRAKLKVALRKYRHTHCCCCVDGLLFLCRGDL